MQNLVFTSIENNLIMLPTLKITTEKKIFYSSVSTFDMDKVGSMEEIGKSLYFSEVSLSVLTKYMFLVCFPCYSSYLGASR